MKNKKFFKYYVSDEDKNTIFEKTNKWIWVYSNYIILFLIIISIIMAFLSTLWDFYNTYFFYFFIADFIISLIFWIEYIYRFINSDNKKSFPFSFLNLLDLLSFLPFFILFLIKWPWFYWLFALFRIFRIFRIIELLEKMPITLGFVKWLNKHKVEIIIWFFIISLILVIFTSLIYVFENFWWAKETFSSLPKTLWWGIYALTTSWDAWMHPESFIWRVLSWILMVMWPILISIISSITVLIFLDSTSIIDLKKRKECKKCWTKNESNSKYCKKCWKELD